MTDFTAGGKGLEAVACPTQKRMALTGCAIASFPGPPPQLLSLELGKEENILYPGLPSLEGGWRGGGGRRRGGGPERGQRGRKGGGEGWEGGRAEGKGRGGEEGWREGWEGGRAEGKILGTITFPQHCDPVSS